MNPRKVLTKTSHRVLPPASQRVLLRRYYRLRGKQIVNILHISKTGGTAIKHAVRHNTVTDTHALLFHSYEVCFLDIPVGESFVFCLRHLVVSFVSASRFRQHASRPMLESFWHTRDSELIQYWWEIVQTLVGRPPQCAASTSS